MLSVRGSKREAGPSRPFSSCRQFSLREAESLLEPLLYASSEEFYRKAKALFYCGHEKNTLVTIIAICLLHWWGPASPGEISADGSFFWISVGVRFAHQIGLHKEPKEGKYRALRRRLWWTLVARDSVISASLGRPRTICSDDSDMSPPSVEDFPVQTPAARLFAPYVTISRLIGDITECRLRNNLSSSKHEFERLFASWHRAWTCKNIGAHYNELETAGFSPALETQMSRELTYQTPSHRAASSPD